MQLGARSSHGIMGISNIQKKADIDDSILPGIRNKNGIAIGDRHTLSSDSPQKRGDSQSQGNRIRSIGQAEGPSSKEPLDIPMKNCKGIRCNGEPEAIPNR